MPTATRPAFECADLLTADSPKDLRVTCITGDSPHVHSHIYMEASVFTPDSRRFVFQRFHTKAAGYNDRFLRRDLWLCDLDDGCALRQLTDHPAAIAPSVAPDGRYVYYMTTQRDPTSPPHPTLHRICLDSFKDETLATFDKVLDGVGKPSQLYLLTTVRGDGGALAFGAFLGDGKKQGMWGVVSFDLTSGETKLVAHSAHMLNQHMQYARTADPQRKHDLLVQHNANTISTPMGEIQSLGRGCTLFVIRDDGTNYRRVPCGNVPHEKVHGHQEWRGDKDTLLVGIDQVGPGDAHTRPVIEATPIPADPNDDTPPALLPGADEHRNDITRSLDQPMCGHTAIDPTGTKFITDMRDMGAPAETTTLHIGTLPDEPNAALRAQYLLDPRSTYTRDQATHPHPFLSPDGKRAFFNTDYTGKPQVWMVEGFEFP